MKNSFDYMWELLKPPPEQQNTKEACRAFWNALTLQRQRLIYYYIRKQVREGIRLRNIPLFVLQDCSPVPTNYNHSNLPLPDEELCIAKYEGIFGIFTKQEATLFGMQDIKPFRCGKK